MWKRIGGKHIPNAIYTKNVGSGAEVTGGVGKQRCYYFWRTQYQCSVQ